MVNVGVDNSQNTAMSTTNLLPIANLHLTTMLPLTKMFKYKQSPTNKMKIPNSTCLVSYATFSVSFHEFTPTETGERSLYKEEKTANRKQAGLSIRSKESMSNN